MTSCFGELSHCNTVHTTRDDRTYCLADARLRDTHTRHAHHMADRDVCTRACYLHCPLWPLAQVTRPYTRTLTMHIARATCESGEVCAVSTIKHSTQEEARGLGFHCHSVLPARCYRSQRAAGLRRVVTSGHSTVGMAQGAPMAERALGPSLRSIRTVGATTGHSAFRMTLADAKVPEAEWTSGSSQRS